ncbi:MAG: N-6 DNA methylase [Candidatus Omnitrophica bacterium]|nr:N-6 DNA methylase [Candidatus Omnitrophota bacterium]
MTKQEAKQQIQKLVEKYQQVAEVGLVKSYNEAQTRNEFIEPLFEFLGWDMRNLTTDNEVTTEENVSGGRVDLAFRFNGIPALFLEAKAMKVNLDEWKWAQQAINYSWNKSVTWAILTDFESIKIFNAEIPPKSISQNLFIELNAKDFINRFDQLWLLSKESFEQKLLDKEAQKWGKLTLRKQVGEKLFEDLMSWRILLTKDFKKRNNLTDEELDEGVQRILDRLIFIRTAEDRKIEPNVLLGISRGGKANAYKQVAKVFRDFDDGFNSKLFAPHYCEEWKASDKTIAEVIKGLYETKDGYRYDFSVISSDVLGGIYEQYLCYVQGRKSEKKRKSKRKSQGIYYTPKYIVEFIVRETLGEVLKRTKPREIPKIKVLDPACGSGSFLIAAYDKIFGTIVEQNPQISLFTKFDILKDNIFGVDLDAQAVEIAQLNLLLKVLSQKTKLPTLQHNISSGNSLVSGNAEKLEKYFGSDFREQKPFDFEDEFKDVFSQGGFDVIIGNPPYVVLKSDNRSLSYFRKTYKVTHGGKVNLYKLFIERALMLLKPSGYLGFICPSNYLSSADSIELRRLLLDHTTVNNIVEYSEKDRVFKDVTQAVTTIIVQKKKSIGNIVYIKTTKHGIHKIAQREFSKNKNLEFIPLDIVISKMLHNFSVLGDVVDGFQGEVNVSTQKALFIRTKKKDYLPLLRGNQISNYALISQPTEYYPISNETRGHNKKERLVFQEVSNQQQKRRIKAVLVPSNYFCGHTTNYCFSKSENVSNLYLLALLNSSAVDYFFRYFNNTNHVPIGEIKNIPIPNASQAEQEKIAKKAQAMLDLHKELQAASPNTDKYNSLKRDIEKLDCEIDEAIYKLYGLTTEEIRTIEND